MWRQLAVATALAFAALVPAASAFPPDDPDSYTYRVPFTFEGWLNPCNDELVTGTGVLYGAVANNGTIGQATAGHAFDSYHATGTGSLGNSYILTGPGSGVETTYWPSGEGGPLGGTMTGSSRATMIAQGTAPDYHGTYLYHFTYLLTGEVIGGIIQSDATCTG